MLKSCGGLDDWFPELLNIELSHIRSIWQMLDDQFQGGDGNTLDWQKYSALGWVLKLNESESLSQRLSVPKDFRRSVMQLSENGQLLDNWRDLTAAGLLKAIENLGALRQTSRSESIIALISVCSGKDHAVLLRIITGVKLIGVDGLSNAGELAGAAIGSAIREARLDYIRSQIYSMSS